MTGKDVLLEKKLVRKSCCNQNIWILPEELKKQTIVAEKQYQTLDKDFESKKKEEQKRKNKRSCKWLKPTTT